jgi:hypothetical protein
LFILPFVLLNCHYLDCAVTDDQSDLIVPAGETYFLHGARTYSNSVEIYGRLVVTPYDDTSGTGTLKLVSPDIIVHAGGEIDANYAGYRADEGPGVGFSPAGTAGSGAGHGGPGGKGYGLGPRGGLPYDYASGEIHMGSGGLSTGTAKGGRGGGSIYLRGTQSITVSGLLTTDGQDGEGDSTAYAAGGGSGGGILIEGSGAVVLIDGVVSANGGNGGSGKYGGGGGSTGKIKVFTGPGSDVSGEVFISKRGLAGASQEMDYPPEDGSFSSIYYPQRVPSYTPPSVEIVEPISAQAGAVEVRFLLTDAEYDMCTLCVEYSVDGGVSFKQATLAPLWYEAIKNQLPIYGTEGIRGSPSGAWENHVLWDSLKDVGVARVENARIRITPDDGFGEPGVADTSEPFGVDNRFVTPGLPVVKYRGPEFIAISIDRGGIYPPAEFAIFNATEDRYVDVHGFSVSLTPVWQTEQEWGVVEVKGLSPGATYRFQVTARDAQVGLETGFGPGLSAATTPLGAFAEEKGAHVIYRLVLDKVVYKFAEPVNIQYIITNTGATPLEFDFWDSCQFFFKVYEGDTLIYDPPRFCLAILTGIGVKPGKSFVHSETWNQTKYVADREGESVWPGHYKMVGGLIGYGATLTVEFDVVSPLGKRIAGRLPGDTTLRREESPFNVSDDLFVPEGVTLTIQPGVELRFDSAYGLHHSGAGLNVQGTLFARGTPEEKIIFRSAATTPSSADWRGITITLPAKEPQYDSLLGKYVDGCVLEHCIIEHASVPLTMIGLSPAVINCIIHNNGDAKAPSQFISGMGSQATFLTSTIVRNFGFISGDFDFANSIVWHNQDLLMEGVSAQHCDIEGGYPGEGNIDGDPLFIGLGYGDYHLNLESPCIDAGTADVQGLPDEDMDGAPRISGTRIDIGADEFADSDADSDGLPDSWEMLYFGSLSFGLDDDPDSDGLTTADELSYGTHPARADTDSDGVPDGREVAAGTDPCDATSFVKVTGVYSGDFGIRLRWSCLPGRRYLVHFSEDMVTWSPLSPELTASSPALLFTDNNVPPPQRRFYRVEVLP